MKKFSEELYQKSLKLDNCNEDDEKIYFTFLRITTYLHDEIQAIIDKNLGENNKSFSSILDMTIETYLELCDITLAKIEHYGIDTHTKIERVDDMKVIYFFTQAIIAEYKNATAPNDIKLISEIAYEYIKKQAYSLNDTLDKSIMLDKIDYMYNSEEIDLDKLWHLFGKYGIYSIVKSVYYMYYNITDPEINLSGENGSTSLQKENAYHALRKAIDFTNERGLSLTRKKVESIAKELGIFLNKECKVKDLTVIYDNNKVNLETMVDLETLLNTFKGKK
jgi:hypothetical protein